MDSSSEFIGGRESEIIKVIIKITHLITARWIQATIGSAISQDGYVLLESWLAEEVLVCVAPQPAVSRVGGGDWRPPLLQVRDSRWKHWDQAAQHLLKDAWDLPYSQKFRWQFYENIFPSSMHLKHIFYKKKNNIRQKMYMSTRVLTNLFVNVSSKNIYRSSELFYEF